MSRPTRSGTSWTELSFKRKNNIAPEGTSTVRANPARTSTLAVGVEYHSQTGKTGENLKKVVKDYTVVKLQCLLAWKQMLPGIIKTDCGECSVCKACKQPQLARRECEAVGQVSHLPCLWACTKCLERNIKCPKCFGVWTTNREIRK